jgi:hypothetical protein
MDDAGKEHVIQFAPENWIVSDRSSAYFNQTSDFFIDAIEDSENNYISNRADIQNKIAKLEFIAQDKTKSNKPKDLIKNLQIYAVSNIQEALGVLADL